MKNFSFGLNRSRLTSCLIGILCLVLIIMLLSPYFTYGKNTTTMVPKTNDAKTDGAQTVLYGRNWVLSGSSEDDENYKELIISADGKNSTLRTTNKLRVNQKYALSVFEAALDNYKNIQQNLDDCIAAENNAWARYNEIGALCNSIAAKMGKEPFELRKRGDVEEVEEEAAETEEGATEEAATEEAATTEAGAEDPYAADYKTMTTAMKNAERQLDKAIESRKTAQNCMDDCKAALDDAYAACLVVYSRDADGNALGEEDPNFIDPAYEKVRVFTADYNQALVDKFPEDFFNAVLSVKDSDFKVWLVDEANFGAEYAEFLNGDKDSKKNRENFYKDVFLKYDEATVAEKKQGYFDSVKDTLEDKDATKIYETMNTSILSRMSAEDRDNLIYSELDTMLSLSNAAFSKAQAAETKTAAALKSGGKTASDATKAVTQIEKQIDNVNKFSANYIKATTSDENNTEGENEEGTTVVTDEETPEVVIEDSLPHIEEYLKTIVDPHTFEDEQTEDTHIESPATVKYNKGNVTIDFANGEQKVTPFSTNLSYDQVESVSIMGFVAFPEDYASNFEATVADYKIAGYSRNSVVLLPIALFILLVVGIVLCIIFRDSIGSGILPACAGILGVIGFIFSKFLKLGDHRVAFIVMFAVLLVVSCCHIYMSIKEKKQKAA